MSIDIDQLNQITQDGQVVTTDGERLGSIGQVYLDDATGAPSWVTVKTGFFGTSENFVPIHTAHTDGHDIVVAYDKDTIKAAPRIDADGALSPEEEQVLYQHYNLDGGNGYATDGTAGHDTTTTDRDFVGTGNTGHDTSGPTTDNAMTRSEEQLRVGTQSVETGRVRLRKYIVTENVTTTVPVSREEVRLEREPITDANAGDALSGPDLSEEEHEVVLHAERPVVEKEAVPVERVRLDTDTVTEQQSVSADVRKEQIEMDDDTVTGTTDRH